MKKVLVFLAAGALATVAAFAQQTGSVAGTVRSADGAPLPGVTVEARSDVLPQPRTVFTGANGGYRFPVLPPGQYEIEFTLEGLNTEVRRAQVFLNQATTVDARLGLEQIAATIDVVAETPLLDPSSGAIKSALSQDVIELLPVGQEYQDLVKLIPAVQYSEEETRGPSAGGNGQDNVYQFDGVNVTLPLFGTLSADPTSNDIAQISVIKGGAEALDFNRSGGFLIDSVSKSGTSQFHGQVSYQLQTEEMTESRETGTASEFDEDRDWAAVSVGGPLLSDQLFFYTSYYRPHRERSNRSNLYGEVPDFESNRDELFGKLTFTPNDSILIHGSYRNSDRDQQGEGVAEEDQAGSTSRGSDSKLEIAILEGSWLLSADSFLSLKYTDFTNTTSGRPDNILDIPLALDGSVALDIANLETQGLFRVPVPSSDAAFNAFIAPILTRYGYFEDGVFQGGGDVGVASQINDQDFFRENAQVGYDHTIGEGITHDLHVGYQWYKDEEDLARTSNGWGVITVPGGRISFNGQPVFYQADFNQQSLTGSTGAPVIHSEFESQNIELNDKIHWGDFAINVGVVLSQDTLYGQGLREDPSALSGFVEDIGNKYEMYQVDFEDQIQPRLGITWGYNDNDTAYASWARYHPAASSLPRAASWDRNLATTIQAYFDADGNFIGSEPLASSSGKLFQPDLDPRAIDEYILGTSQQINSQWVGRAYARYRRGYNFWEDTNNNARSRFEPPPGIPTEDYIPQLDDFRDQIGSGSSYVIAELDGAFTKYYEVSLESEWRGRNAFVRGSYTWSHYYGNFDQDNTTTENDDNVFIGSSFIADGAGRQLWDNRYGDLRGDRRHLLKVYGFYNFAWNGSAGVFGVYQSGQPWEVWSFEPYSHLTTSTSDTSRFAEPAGSRDTDDHYQVDLNYTHDFRLSDRFALQAALDVFNVTDNQTGYNIQNKDGEPNFGEPRSFYDPRRFQVAVRFLF